MTRDDIARAIAAMIIGAALMLLVCVAWAQRQPQELRIDAPRSITPASEDARNVPWRLLTPCRIDRRNVPAYRESKT